MKKIIFGTILLFVLIFIACLVYEYQPHYNEKQHTEDLPEIKVSNSDINNVLPITNDLSEVLSTNKDEEIDKFFEIVSQDDFDFALIQGNYRQKVVEFYQNGHYYNCWKVLNEYVQFTNIKPEKDGKDKVYYKLELSYLVPRSIDYCQAISEEYDGTLKSIEKYLDVMYSTSNIQVYKETNYVSIDQNFYEFLIMHHNLEKKMADILVMERYQITLDQNPY